MNSIQPIVYIKRDNSNNSNNLNKSNTSNNSNNSITHKKNGQIKKNILQDILCCTSSKTNIKN